MTKAKSSPTASAAVEIKLSPIGTGKPRNMHIIGPMHLALAQSVVHIRNGYTFSDLPIETFGGTGSISFHLELGNPDTAIIKAAEVSCAEALALEAVQRQREIEAEAKRLYAEKVLAEEQAAIAAEIAEQEKALRKLQQAMADSRAKLV